MKSIEEILTFDPSIFPKEPEFIRNRELILQRVNNLYTGGKPCITKPCKTSSMNFTRAKLN